MFIINAGLTDQNHSEFETSSNSSSLLSTRDIMELVEQLHHECFRSTTQQNYYGIWKNFNKIFLRLDVKPNAWEERLTLYVGYLVGCNKQSATIKSYISVIKAVLYGMGIELNEDCYLLVSLTKACRLSNDKLHAKIPIQWSLFNAIIDKCDDLEEQHQWYLTCMYRALFVISYYGMLWIGEVSTEDHPIKATEVHMGQNKQKLMIILRTSKMHNLFDKPQIIKISVIERPRDVKGHQKILTRGSCPFKLV